MSISSPITVTVVDSPKLIGQGTASNPIVLGDSLTPVRSPVKVIPGEKYRNIVKILGELSDCDSSDSESADGSLLDAYEDLLPNYSYLDEPDNENSDSEPDETKDQEEATEDLKTLSGVPIFERPPSKYYAFRIMEILLDPNIDTSKIAKQRPLQTQCSATFIVDINHLAHPDDIKRDMYGKWLYKGSHTDVFRCTFDQDNKVCVEKALPSASGSSIYYLRRLHSVHPSNKGFRRIVAIISDADNHPHHLCLLAYYLPKNFVPTILPHGNSKKEAKPFYPTLPSTMAAIREQCLSGKNGPKKVVSTVSSMVGGVLSASDACELPRNEQQVSDLKQRQKKVVTAGTTASCDELAVVMHKAYLEDGNQQFIREVRTLREPGIIVALDRQLDDIARFCTNENNFGILTVDPTFNLGEFDVTVTTYRHLLLKCRRTQQHPAFIGPVMVHFKKSFSTYLFFSSTLVGLRPKLSSLKSFGTDGEVALYQAFKHSFPTAIHLLCSIHARRNVTSKLREVGVCESVQRIIIGDIFGKQVGTQYLEGLVDVESEQQYEDGLQSLCERWKMYDTYAGGPVSTFIQWYMKFKTSLIKEGLLRSKRQSAGLGNPPPMFTTNASESINALLKNKLDYKKHELSVFLDKLKETIDEQERELERAVINSGKYQFCDDYRHLIKQQDEWFLKMSTSQRETHLKKVASTKLQESPTSNLFHVSSQHANTINQAGPSRSLVLESQDALSSNSSGHHMLPEQNQSLYDSISYNDDISSSSHHYRYPAFQQEEDNDKPNCSRRLFVPVSQDQLLTDGDVQPTTPAYSSSTQSQFNMPSHQYLSSTIASTSQIQTAPKLIHANLPVSSVSEDELLSVAISNFSASVITPLEVLKAIWRKAYELLHEPNSISHAPGQGDNARMVKSYSGSRPHLVSRKKSGQYACDNMCPNWRSLGICAHSVAAAEDNHELQFFIRWFLKAKKVPNLTKLATAEMPAGRGRKGTKAPPKKKPKMQPSSRIPFSLVARVQENECNPTSGSSSSSMNLLDLPQEPQAASSASEIDSSQTRQIFNNFSTGTATISISSTESSPSPKNVIMNATHVNIHPSELAFSNMPIAPPPLIRCATPTTSDSPDTSPFILTFITGNIRVCRGCRQKYPKPAPPPLNLIVKHQEWQEFIGPSGMPQTRYGNVYYHCNIPCIRARNIHFETSMLQIPATVLVQLLPSHTEYLSKYMPGRL